jgi:hypothetical protein
MRLLTVPFFCLVLLMGSASAQSSRLEIAFGPKLIKLAAHLCQSAMNQPKAGSLRLTDLEIIGWHPDALQLALDPAQVSPVDANHYAERCFRLSIDGTPITAGWVHAGDTHAVAGQDSLKVVPRGDSLYLQLLDGRHPNRPIAGALRALNEIFERPADLARWQAYANGPETYARMGQAWANAVQHLIAHHQIRKGVDFDTVVKQIGKPTSSLAHKDGAIRHAWYFNTPRHVNPRLIMVTQHDRVMSYRLESH